VHRDARRHSRAILAKATPERLLAAVDALVHSDGRRHSSSILAIATAERLLAAVDALVLSDARRLSSAILAMSTAERLLARVSALVASDARWLVSAILAIPTPQPLHTRTVITSTSQRVVATICATHTTRTQSTQPPRSHTHTIAKHMASTHRHREHASRHAASQAQAGAGTDVVLSLDTNPRLGSPSRVCVSVCVVAAPASCIRVDTRQPMHQRRRSHVAGYTALLPLHSRDMHTAYIATSA
jgi:hypothetical protein